MIVAIRLFDHEDLAATLKEDGQAIAKVARDFLVRLELRVTGFRVHGGQ